MMRQLGRNKITEQKDYSLELHHLGLKLFVWLSE